MTTDPQAAAARAHVAARLAAHKAARATIHADVWDARDAGMNPNQIATESGITRAGVVKILTRPDPRAARS